MSRNLRILFAVLIIGMSGIVIGGAWVRADTYGNFNALQTHNEENVDYRIDSRDSGSGTAVVAIHGGNIEKETTQIASAVANLGGFNFYSFEGLRPQSSSLHITSTRFDESTARNMVAESSRTLSIHGCYGTSQALTNLGGLDKALGQKVREELQAAGFKVVNSPGNIGGTAPGNICNRNSIKKGVQLELSVPLRNQLAGNSQAFDRYVAALASALK